MKAAELHAHTLTDRQTDTHAHSLSLSLSVSSPLSPCGSVKLFSTPALLFPPPLEESEGKSHAGIQQPSFLDSFER